MLNAPIKKFTARYTEAREDGAYRFRFHCAICGEGHATGLIRADSAKAALDTARHEAREYFNGCQKCGKWICDSPRCYDMDEMTCTGCAQRHARKAPVRLFAVFTALEVFRLCYMRLCFLISERNGLSGYEDYIFILICLGVVAGLVAMPLLLDKAGLGASKARTTLAVRVCIIISAITAIASYFTFGYAVLALQFVTAASVAGAIAVCMRNIAGSGLTARSIGICMGISSAVVLLFIVILFLLPFAIIPENIILTTLCVLLAAAMICYDGLQDREEYAEAFERNLTSQSRLPAHAVNLASFTPRMIKVAFLVMCLYALVCGLLDNIYFFEAAFVEFEGFLFYLNFYAILLYVAAGFLFLRVNTTAAVIGAFALVCVGQSMAFFLDNSLLVFPHMIFSNAGDTMLEIFLISVPLAYCASSKRKPGIIPGLGYILLCGSFTLMASLFLLMPDADPNIALGVTLLVALAAIMLTVHLSNEYKISQGRLAQRDFEERLTEALRNADSKPPLEGLTDSYSLTNREVEVLRLLLEGEPTSEIARVMFITEKTVRKYVSSMLSKTGTKTRMELVTRFNRSNS